MGVCDVPGISYVCEIVGEGAASLVSAPFDWLASACGKAAGWVFEQVWNVFDKTTLVDVTNPQYTKVYALMFGVAIMVMFIFFCSQLITGLIRHEPGALGRAVTGLAKAVLGSFLILTQTGLLLEATDQISIGIVQAAGNTMESMGGKIAVLAAGLTGISIAADRETCDSNAETLEHGERLNCSSTVREGGVEPPPHFWDTDLNRARLPIPPLARAKQIIRYCPASATRAHVWVRWQTWFRCEQWMI